MHGDRDSVEQTMTYLLRGLALTGTVSLAAVSMCFTAAVPNPLTLFLAAHATGTVSSMLGIGVASSTASLLSLPNLPSSDNVHVQLLDLARDMDSDEAKKLQDALKATASQRGTCDSCKRKRNTSGCTYYWSCCRKTLREVDHNLMNEDIQGCHIFCEHCEKTVLTSDGLERSGCLRECQKCLMCEDAEQFKVGCSERKHTFTME